MNTLVVEVKGAQGSGKTLLLNAIQQWIDATTSCSVSEIGENMLLIEYNGAAFPRKLAELATEAYEELL